MAQRPSIWTVGHSNHEFDHFANLLIGEKIEYVVDVRSFPFSRFVPQFNRDSLEARLPSLAVRYLFLGEELGGRPTREEHYDDDGHALYGPMSEEPNFREALDRVKNGVEKGRVALLCSEADPTHCHRRLLVGRVLAREGLTLKHLLQDGSVKIEDEVRLGESDNQTSMFEEDIPWRSTQSVSHKQRLSPSSDD